MIVNNYVVNCYVVDNIPENHGIKLHSNRKRKGRSQVHKANKAAVFEQ